MSAWLFVVRVPEHLGIQGELVTDCRYLNVAGAKAAIDSGTNAAARRAHLEPRRRHFAEFFVQDGEKYASPASADGTVRTRAEEGGARSRRRAVPDVRER